jgi:hypothetical protein
VEAILCPAGQSLVASVHARGEAVSDDLDATRMVGNLDEPLPGSDMDLVYLHAVGPVGDAQFKTPKADGANKVGAWSLWVHKEVRSTGRDIGEHPIESADAVTDKHAIAG